MKNAVDYNRELIEKYYPGKYFIDVNCCMRHTGNKQLLCELDNSNTFFQGTCIYPTEVADLLEMNDICAIRELYLDNAFESISAHCGVIDIALTMRFGV